MQIKDPIAKTDHDLAKLTQPKPKTTSTTEVKKLQVACG